MRWSRGFTGRRSSRWTATALLLLWCAAAGSAFAGDARPERLIVYFNEDNERVDRAIAKLTAAFQTTGLSSKYRIRLEHVVVDFANERSMEARMRSALAQRPAILIAPNGPAAVVAKSLTKDVPIIFSSYQDPVELGLVGSLGRPGGNVTGLTNFLPIDSKRFELLRQLLPEAKRMGILVDHWWTGEPYSKEVIDLAGDLHGFRVEAFFAETIEDLERILTFPRSKKIDVWYVPYTNLPFQKPDALVRLFERQSKPVLYPATLFVERGGLISYQQTLSLDDSVRMWAVMIGLVLDGVSPGEIPIERPKYSELAINLDTAQKLGLKIPRSLLKRANRIVSSERTELPPTRLQRSNQAN